MIIHEHLLAEIQAEISKWNRFKPDERTEIISRAVERWLSVRDDFPIRKAPIALLLTIARNEGRRLRQEQSYLATHESCLTSMQSESIMATASCSPDSNLERYERVELVRTHLGLLRPSYRRVIEVCDLQEMSRKDAAALLGTSENNITVRLYRARNTLRKLLSTLI